MNDTKQLINDGGPAFPCASSMIVNGKQATVPAQGMTLRDYFAGKALAGMPWHREIAVKEQAKECFQIADAMLAESKRKESVK